MPKRFLVKGISWSRCKSIRYDKPATRWNWHSL